MQAAASLLIPCLLMMDIVFAGGELQIHHAWIKEAPPGSKVMAGYMMISNQSAQPVQLTGVRCLLFEKIEFHVTEVKNNIASMHRVDAISIPAGSEFILAPGGHHLMLFNGSRQFNAGDSIPIDLLFSDGSTISVSAVVKRGDPPSDHHH
jgi:Uncharacterized protein conserved in bacteria